MVRVNVRMRIWVCVQVRVRGTFIDRIKCRVGVIDMVRHRN